MKTKKLLLTALFSAFMVGSAFAQFNFSTSTNIGQINSSVIPANNDTLTVHFNTAILNSTWAYNVAVPPVAIVTYKKCQTQKGLQVLAYPDATTTTAYGFGGSDCRDYTAQRNPIHVASIDSLRKIMTKSILTGSGGSTLDSLSRPAACLFDKTTTDQAFGMYPGKCKRIEYGFYYNLIGKAAATDLSFDIDTYDAGTTGKTASYELSVYYSTGGSTPVIADANLLAPKIAGFYVSGSGLLHVNLAAALGLSPTALSNKRLLIFFKTLGTSNAGSIVDGLRNEVDANNVPLATDPTIIFDNFVIQYGTAQWVEPAGVIASSVFNYNNGSPVNLGVGSIDYSGGTQTLAPGGNVAITFNLTDAKRLSTLDITEANDGGGHSAKFSFAATGAVMRKALDGTFTIPVPYTYTPSDGTTKMDLLIAAPTAGSVNDTLQVTLNASNVTLGMTPTVRLEITNGVRFWYNFGVDGTSVTSAPTVKLSNASIWSADKSIFVSNSKSDVIITNVSGQRVKVATPSEATNGITVKTGLYIVKAGNTVQKVLVQ